MSVLLNGAYLGRHDGTAAWSECFVNAFPANHVIRPAFDPTRHGRHAFAWKILFEATFQLRGGATRIHPYAAAAMDPGASIVLLDAIGSGGDRRGWHPWLVHQSIRMARRVATISSPEARSLQAIHRREFSVLTPHPVDSFFSTSRTAPQPRSRRALHIGYWGGWHPRKGILEFLAAMPERSDVRFVCTGPPQPTLRERSDIQWLGRLSRAEQLRAIDSVDASIYVSRREGFGLPPYESLLRDKPVLLRDLPCYTDFLRTDHPAVVVWADVETPADAMERLRHAIAYPDPREALLTPTLARARSRLTHQIERWLST